MQSISYIDNMFWVYCKHLYITPMNWSHHFADSNTEIENWSMMKSCEMVQWWGGGMVGWRWRVWGETEMVRWWQGSAGLIAVCLLIYGTIGGRGRVIIYCGQAPVGSRDWSRDPGLFLIPIPIPENFFQNRDRDQNRDLSFSSYMFIFRQFVEMFGIFL